MDNSTTTPTRVQDPTIDPRFYGLAAHLWRGGVYAHLWTPQGERSYSQWQPVTAAIIAPLAWRQRGNVYYTVNPLGPGADRGIYKKSRNADVIAVNCLYADFDGKDWDSHQALLQHVAGLPWQPSALVHSGGGVHAYWLAADPWQCSDDASKEAVATLQHAWVHLVQADTSVHDLARILRVPGTLNHKYNPPRPVTFLRCDLGRLYSWGELLSAAADLVTTVGEKRRQWAQVGFEHTAGGGRTLLLGDDETLVKAAMTWKTGAKFARLWRGDTSDYRGDESAADQGLAALLVFATGHDAPRVERMMRASGLYRPKWERPGYLEQTIMRAMYSCGASYTPPSAERRAAVEAAAGAVEGGK